MTSMTISEIRHQIAESIISYLADRESYDATEELLNIPRFLESFEKAKAEIGTQRYQNWRDIRRDV